MLAKLPERVELLRASQRFGFGHRGAKSLPRDHGGDRAIGVLLAVARGYQRGADARVETDLLVDRPRIGLEGAGVAAVGAAEHCADQPVEQVDRLIGQARRDVQRRGNQRRMPALPLVTGDMLHRGTPGLTSELRQAQLVDEVAAARLDVDGAHMLQPLNQPKHRRGFGTLRHLPQPGEPTQAALFPGFGQRIEAPALLGRQPIGQPPMRFSPRRVTQFGA
jgi:hypothetical protein